MNELWNQLILQMVADTLRVIMLLYGLCIVAAVYVIMDKAINFIFTMIGRGCKAIWSLLKRVLGRQSVMGKIESEEA